MRISSNIASIQARRHLYSSRQRQVQNSWKTASGSRINKASDDAAGLAISEHFRANIKSVGQAKRNNADGISIIQVAEGSMEAISQALIRIRELGIQAASDTVGDAQRNMINYEVDQLGSEIDRIARSAKWQSSKLLTGESDNFDFQVGVYNNENADRITFVPSKNNATISGLGLSGLNFTTKSGAQDSLTELDVAINKVSGMRSNLGAMQARLISAMTNLGVYAENMKTSESRIRDTDFAKTTADQTKDNILVQASTMTLAQANQKSEKALMLLDH